jgi:dTDP-4-dehydrorhamnose 3,5-epimerase
MRFDTTPLQGALIVEPEPIEDDRGHFARSWCAREFAKHGLSASIAQCNVSHNRRRGTLRGLHFQRPPHEEVKLVRCTRGAIYDVIVDIRPASPTYHRWFAVELCGEAARMLYVPEGFAHGFQTLADDTEVFYQMSRAYHRESAGGIRYDDASIGVDWPIESPIVSDRDRALGSVTRRTCEGAV